MLLFLALLPLVTTACAGTGAEYLYVTLPSMNQVQQFSIKTTGLLTSLGTVPTGPEPSTLAADPKSHFAYVLHAGADPSTATNPRISQFAIPANGQLTALTPPEGPSNRLVDGRSIVVSPDGQMVYALFGIDVDLLSGLGAIGGYAVATNGALTASGGAGVDRAPSGMAMSPNGQFLFVSEFGPGLNDPGGLDVYATPLNPLVGAVGYYSTGSTAIGFGAPYVEPQGRFLYSIQKDCTSGLTSCAYSVLAFSIGATGAITLIPAATISTGIDPGAFAFTPDGRYAYRSDTTANTVTAYTIGTSGALTSLGTVVTDPGPGAISVEPKGQFLYTVNAGGTDISEYSIAGSGTLTALGTMPTSAPGGGMITIKK
jgi:6-phosphogluconolactonase (cycloisomerase 2 family)